MSHFGVQVLVVAVVGKMARKGPKHPRMRQESTGRKALAVELPAWQSSDPCSIAGLTARLGSTNGLLMMALTLLLTLETASAGEP